MLCYPILSKAFQQYWVKIISLIIYSGTIKGINSRPTFAYKMLVRCSNVTLLLKWVVCTNIPCCSAIPFFYLAIALFSPVADSGSYKGRFFPLSPRQIARGLSPPPVPRCSCLLWNSRSADIVIQYRFTIVFLFKTGWREKTECASSSSLPDIQFLHGCFQILQIH